MTIAHGSIRVTNRGNAPVSPPVKVEFGVWDGFSNTWWPIKVWSNFTSNAIWYSGCTWYNNEFTATIGCNIPEGYYKWILRVDGNNRVSESNETNNTLRGTEYFYVRH